MIAPSHGVIWRKEPLQIVSKYQEWAKQAPDRSAVVLYATMWNGTRRMAEAIGSGLAAKGVTFKAFDVATSDRNDIIAEIFKAKGVIIGSPTFNQGILPSLSPILEDLKGLRFKNKVGAAFGSYGWSGESVKLIEEHLGHCKIPVVASGVLAKWQPRPEDLSRCTDLGTAVADAIVA
jgi:flavorubredoxin